MKIRLRLAGLLVAAVAGCGTDLAQPKQIASGSREAGEVTTIALRLPGMT
jgi:hypothetical protein